MSHQEKLEEMSKEKWMDQIQSFHITRADMNRLIMNYLVTGKSVSIRIKSNHVSFPPIYVTSSKQIFLK